MSGTVWLRWLTGFGRFWYDFIVGDSPALAIGGAAVLVLGALLAWAGGGGIAQVVLPLAVALTLAVSVWRR